MQKYNTRYVLSILVPDRVGILSSITSAITDLGANIEGISQTVVQGYFTVILMAGFKEKIAEDSVCKAVLERFHEGEASVIVKPFDPAAPVHAKGDRYILTMSGKDQPGILKKLTTYLAKKNINIEDLFFRITGENVTHIGEVTVPLILDIKQPQDELSDLMGALGLTISLQHENFFRATNEIGAIQQILKESHYV